MPPVIMPLLILLIFAGLGPLIGFACLLLGEVVPALLGQEPRPTPSIQWGLATLKVMGFFVLFSYLWGGLQALLTGFVAVLSYGATDYTRVSFAAVMCTAAATAIVFVLVTGSAYLPIIVHLGAASGSWLIAVAAIKIVGQSAPDRQPTT